MKIYSVHLSIVAIAFGLSLSAMAKNCVVYTEGCVEERKDEFNAAWKSLDSLYKQVKSCQEYQTKITKIKEIRDDTEKYYQSKKDHAKESSTDKEKALTYQEARDKIYNKSASIKKIIESLVDATTTTGQTQNYGGGNEYTLSSTTVDYPCTKGKGTGKDFSSPTARGGDPKRSDSSSTATATNSGTRRSSDDGDSCSDSDMTKKYKFCKKKYVCKEWELAD